MTVWLLLSDYQLFLHCVFMWMRKYFYIYLVHFLLWLCPGCSSTIVCQILILFSLLCFLIHFYIASIIFCCCGAFLACSFVVLLGFRVIWGLKWVLQNQFALIVDTDWILGSERHCLLSRDIFLHIILVSNVIIWYLMIVIGSKSLTPLNASRSGELAKILK